MSNRLQRLLYVVSCVFLFAKSSSVFGIVPSDFEVLGSAGALSLNGNVTTVRITFNGNGTYALYTASDTLDPPAVTNSFVLTNAQLDQIWQAVQSNDFFSIASDNSDSGRSDGNFLHLTIRADGNSHTVEANNVQIASLDNIVNVINSVTPSDNDLLYNIWPILELIPHDVCGPLPAQALQFQSASSTSVVQLLANTKRDLIGTQQSFTYQVLNTAQYTSLQTASTQDTSGHPGTVVGTTISLIEGVESGLVSLDAKGGFFGDQVSITADNNLLGPVSPFDKPTVDVKLYLELWGGDVSTAATSLIQGCIESVWGGKSGSNGKTLNVQVESRTDTTSAGPPSTTGYHQIQVIDNPNLGAGEIVCPDGLGQGICSGTINLAASVQSGNEACALIAHEAGHLLGLPDRYDDYRKQADGTWIRLERPDLNLPISGPFSSADLSGILAASGEYPSLTEAQIEAMLDDPMLVRTTAPDNLSDLMGDAYFVGDPYQADVNALAAKYENLLIEVLPGDVLVNKNDEEQNFVITRSTDLFVPAGDTTTLNGLYAACIDENKGEPEQGDRFDLAPRLESWTGIQGAPSLLTLVNYVDEHELFCEDYPTQLAIWSITDDKDFRDKDNYPDVSELLTSAGVNTENLTDAFPHLRDPNALSPETDLVALSIYGDLDGDLDVDRDDLLLLRGAINQVADSVDPYDIDGDGRISALDTRKLILLCTRVRCATN